MRRVRQWFGRPDQRMRSAQRWLVNIAMGSRVTRAASETLR